MMQWLSGIKLWASTRCANFNFPHGFILIIYKIESKKTYHNAT